MKITSSGNRVCVDKYINLSHIWKCSFCIPCSSSVDVVSASFVEWCCRYLFFADKWGYL